MLKVTVRPGMVHRGTVKGGEVVSVSESELRAFGDKFIFPAINATSEAWAEAQEQRIDLRTVKGSGKNGRILKRDLEGWPDGGTEHEHQPEGG